VGADERSAGAFSVEQPLWRALSAFRLLTVLYAVSRYAGLAKHYQHPLGAWIYLGVLTAWTFATVKPFSAKSRCSWRWLSADLALVVAGILLTHVFDSHLPVFADDVTLPTIRAAGAVLGFAVMGGWLPGAAAALIVGLADVTKRGLITTNDFHNIVLLLLAGVAIGYVVELARASEQTLARALEVQAATRERERLARDIHDGVLQVLSMVQRRGAEVGGEAAELGRMAGEQEIALRVLVAEGLAPNPSCAAPADADAEQDLRGLIAPMAGSRVTVSAPGTPVLLPGRSVSELGAAVGAALDNVRRHAGPQARAWILVEDEPEEVVVSVRDDGPGFDAAVRLGEAAREGRLGVRQSIRGRLSDLGGSAEIVSVPGQGTEVELRVPRRHRRSGEGSATR